MVNDLLLSEKRKYRSFSSYDSEMGLEYFTPLQLFLTTQTLIQCANELRSETEV